MSATLTIHDGRLIKGNETRAAILQVAIQIASEEGLEGLSLGRLADDVGMSKSGLFAHFRSKEDLQLAVVDTARDLLMEQVVTPARKLPAGIKRLRKLADTWLAYAQGQVFRGGCFFVAASMEFDSRPGKVRDRVYELMATWMAALAAEVHTAKENKELLPSADEEQIAFEFNAQMMGANWAFQLLKDKKAFARARTAIMERLESFTPHRRH
jgi:AcrR family transcriptional regulator